MDDLLLAAALHEVDALTPGSAPLAPPAPPPPRPITADADARWDVARIVLRARGWIPDPSTSAWRRGSEVITLAELRAACDAGGELMHALARRIQSEPKP